MSGNSSIKTIWPSTHNKKALRSHTEYSLTLVGQPLKTLDVEFGGTAFECWDDDARYHRPMSRAELTVWVRHIPTQIEAWGVIKPKAVWTEKQLLHSRKKVYDKVFGHLEDEVVKHLNKLQ